MGRFVGDGTGRWVQPTKKSDRIVKEKVPGDTSESSDRIVREKVLAPGEKLPWHMNNPWLIGLAVALAILAIYLLH